MIICEFCLQYTKDGQCAYGLRIPKRMGCREFDPGIDKFCSNPDDFVNPSQIIQMATYFGIKGTELKKVKVVAAQAGNTRQEAAPEDSVAVPASEVESTALTAPEPESTSVNESQNQPIADEQIHFSASTITKSDF